MNVRKNFNDALTRKCAGSARSEGKRPPTNPGIRVRFSPLQQFNISFAPWQKNMRDLDLFEFFLQQKETKAPSTGKKGKRTLHFPSEQKGDVA